MKTSSRRSFFDSVFSPSNDRDHHQRHRSTVCGIFFFTSLWFITRSSRTTTRRVARAALGQSLRRKLPSLTVKKKSESARKFSRNCSFASSTAVGVGTTDVGAVVQLWQRESRRKRKWDGRRRKDDGGGEMQTRPDSDRKKVTMKWWKINPHIFILFRFSVCSLRLIVVCCGCCEVSWIILKIENENCTISLSRDSWVETCSRDVSFFLAIMSRLVWPQIPHITHLILREKSNKITTQHRALVINSILPKFEVFLCANVFFFREFSIHYYTLHSRHALRCVQMKMIDRTAEKCQKALIEIEDWRYRTTAPLSFFKPSINGISQMKSRPFLTQSRVQIEMKSSFQRTKEMVKCWNAPYFTR